MSVCVMEAGPKGWETKEAMLCKGDRDGSRTFKSTILFLIKYLLLASSYQAWELGAIG